MSYTETVYEIIHGSVYADYPASEHGGSMLVSYSEQISISVTVEDEDFSDSVTRCTGQIGVLDGALRLSAEKQKEAKKQFAEKISDSMISGFMGYMVNTFSEEMTKFANECNAIVPSITTYMSQLESMKKRMESDYNIIKRRYISIFKELDEELERNMMRMYAPCFALVEGFLGKMTDDLLVGNIANTFSYSSSIARSDLALRIAILKKSASELIKRVEDHLLLNKKLDSYIAKYVHEVFHDETWYYPVFSLETEDLGDEKTDLSIHVPSILSDDKRNEILLAVGKEIENRNVALFQMEKEKLQNEFLLLLEKEKDERKRKNILRLWNNFKNQKAGEENE